MKQAVKFTFDTHFGERPAHSAADAKSSNSLTDTDLEAARQQGYGERKDEMLAVDHRLLHITRAAARQRGCKFPRTGR